MQELSLGFLVKNLGEGPEKSQAACLKGRKVQKVLLKINSATNIWEKTSKKIADSIDLTKCRRNVALVISTLTFILL